MPLKNKAAKTLMEIKELRVENKELKEEMHEYKLQLRDFGDRLQGAMLNGITRGIEQGEGATAAFKRGFKGVQGELTGARNRALAFANNLSKGGRASRAIGAAMRLALGPIGLAVAAAAGLFMFFRKINKEI